VADWNAGFKAPAEIAMPDRDASLLGGGAAGGGGVPLLQPATNAPMMKYKNEALANLPIAVTLWRLNLALRS